MVLDSAPAAPGISWDTHTSSLIMVMEHYERGSLLIFTKILTKFHMKYDIIKLGNIVYLSLYLLTLNSQILIG